MVGATVSPFGIGGRRPGKLPGNVPMRCQTRTTRTLAYFAAGGAFRYRSANFRNVGQFGPVVWPPACWRKAMSPSISAGLLRRELGGAQVLLAQQLVDRPGGDAGQEHALGVDPAAFAPCSDADADEHRPRGAQRDQLVGSPPAGRSRSAGRRT